MEELKTPKRLRVKCIICDKEFGCKAPYVREICSSKCLGIYFRKNKELKEEVKS